MFGRLVYNHYWGTVVVARVNWVLHRQKHQDEKSACQEVAMLGTAGEAPLQIIFTLWLMLREVLEAPNLGKGPILYMDKLNLDESTDASAVLRYI